MVTIPEFLKSKHVKQVAATPKGCKRMREVYIPSDSWAELPDRLQTLQRDYDALYAIQFEADPASAFYKKAKLKKGGYPGCTGTYGPCDSVRWSWVGIHLATGRGEISKCSLSHGSRHRKSFDMCK
jgi:hypothetical protein